MSETQDRYVYISEASEIMGVEPHKIFYHAERGDIAREPGRQRKDNRYRVSDLLALKAKLKEQRHRKRPPATYVDWMGIADMPSALKLDMQVFGAENVEVGDIALYSSWLRKNAHLTHTAFDKERNILAYISLIPLPEQHILDILTHKRTELTIQPDEIETYERPGEYVLLAEAAVTHPDRPELFGTVLRAAMQYWIDAYPERVVSRIYAQAATPKGDILIQRLHFAQLYLVENGKAYPAEDAYVLNLARPGANKIVREFQNELRKKSGGRGAALSPLPTLEIASRPPEPPGATLEEAAPQPPVTRPRTPLATVAAPELPAGTLHIQQFLEHHGLKQHRRRILGYLDTSSNGLQHLAYPKPNRPEEKDRYLTRGQQEQLLTWLKEKHPEVLA